NGLFCKDGRGWSTSALGRGHGLDWPHPSTVFGALRSLWGRARERRAGVCFSREEWPARTADMSLGANLALRRPWGEPWQAKHRVWPAPADALLTESGLVQRLEPKPPTIFTLGGDDDQAREGLWTAGCPRQKPIRGRAWWGETDFVHWLCGREPASRGALADLEPPRRLQAHVAICPDKGVGRDGYLYGHDVVETLELTHQWGLGCRVEADDGEHLELAFLGGDRRPAWAEAAAPELFTMPPALGEAFAAGCRGLRLVVVRPTIFAAGWLPDGLHANEGVYRGRLPGLEPELILRAAFVPRPLAVSGWDMASNRSKPTARVVAPGSVYAFERADGRPFGREHAQ
ncbi:MAG: CRISPR-associated protein Crm3, partial [Myxococcales bacterium]|nr:CRISPR-associated protein Crm3 [Myxococcales bacterium]